ncbi:DUF397 domain-containing protein [Micromonospora aurantiaca (nom. illeg.)]|uniref:DUF397 domain-containing protein n=1 Tax=Micromonospora aurantiaca (nom. illeg.) TaxID=47850 RepID=UPI0033DC3E57
MLDKRITQLAHQPARPIWDCRVCGQLWPCAPAKVRLAEAYSGDRQGLAIFMGSLYAAAVPEQPGVPSGLLYAQFVSWTRVLTPPVDRPQVAAGSTARRPTVQFVRPNRCDNSGPNCVEVGIDRDGSRIVRSSKQPQQQVVFDHDEWTAFIESVRAGQSF